MNAMRRNNRIYVRLLSAETGAVVGGETMPALPTSVRSILGTDSSVSSSSVSRSVMGAWELRTSTRGEGLARAPDHPDVGQIAPALRLIRMPTRLLSRVCVAVLAAGAVVLSARLAASGSVFWTVASPADLLKGTSNGVFVGLDGAVTAGPQLANRLTIDAGADLESRRRPRRHVVGRHGRRRQSAAPARGPAGGNGVRLGRDERLRARGLGHARVCGDWTGRQGLRDRRHGRAARVLRSDREVHLGAGRGR